MCADGWANDNPAVDECEECGAPIDVDGDAVGYHCHYSKDPCDVCGDAPCDGSC